MTRVATEKNEEALLQVALGGIHFTLPGGEKVQPGPDTRFPRERRGDSIS